MVPAIVLWSLLHACSPAQAKMADVEQQQAKAIQNYIQRFSDFTQDKDVMGRPKNPMGQTIQGKQKQSYDSDDQIAFQSDLTYHDFMYRENDEDYEDKNNKTKTRELPEGVSPHGAIAKGNGSSTLERVVYQVFNQFYDSKNDNKANQDADKTGIKYDGALKIETVKVDPATVKQKGGTDRVERYQMRDEAVEKINGTGDFAFQQIEKVAKDPGKQNDPQAMGNLEFYYEAANRGLQAMWNSVLADVGQRRAYKVPPEGNLDNITLNEETPDCASWAQSAMGGLPKDYTADQRKDAQQNVQKMMKGCQQMVQTNYKMINPRIDAQKGGLQQKGPQGEDGIERDGRVQLEMLAKVGTRAGEVPSNWQYKEADEKALVTIDYDKQGQPSNQKGMRMDEQVNAYNKQLDAATEKLGDIKSRYPELALDSNQIKRYQIQNKSESVMQITKLPKDAVDEQFEISGPNRQANPADSYSKLMQQTQ
jgi:hypothetical protein